MVIKIDLYKEYEKINWLYMRMLLTHLGFHIDLINWIMSRITNISFVVLINGVASQLFSNQNGLRQGCPLSPLLFLLAVEGLIQLIHQDIREGTLGGIEVAPNICDTHIVFVDDILLFNRVNKGEIRILKIILNPFMKVTRLTINKKNSSLSYEGIPEADLLWTLDFPSFLQASLEACIKYLCFLLKADGYYKHVWFWLVSKIAKIINSWSHKSLSRAGILVLIKSVLLTILVYWISLGWVPIGIINKIRRICSNFLWLGKEDKFLLWVA